MTDEARDGKIVEGRLVGPEKVMISPTDACNLRCRTCWRLAKEEDPNRGTVDELTLGQIEAVLADCRTLGARCIDFTGGGEPFCRPDIFEILRMIKELGFEGTLTTNGMLVSERRAGMLIDEGLDDICLSIESARPELNDAIRGEGVFEGVEKALRALGAARGARGLAKPTLRLASVVTALNYGLLHELAAFAAGMGVAHVYFSLMIEWPTNLDLSLAGVEEARVMEAVGRARDSFAAAGVGSNLASILKYGLSKPRRPRFCFAPYDMSFVNSRGEVLACCILASVYENVLGNVRETPLAEMWGGEKMRQFRERLRRGELFPDCRRCLPDFADTYEARYEAAIKLPPA